MKKPQNPKQGVFGFRSMIAGGAAFGLSLSALQADEAPGSPSREWKSEKGKFSVQAVFDSYDAFTKQVTLRKEDSTSIKVPLSRLSADDRSYVEERAPQSASATKPGKEIKMYGSCERDRAWKYLCRQDEEGGSEGERVFDSTSHDGLQNI